MSLTYEEILTKMQDEYYKKTNQKPMYASDLMFRFEILATQLYSLSQAGDYILKQAFLQTATGSFLDNHCGARGIKRKDSSAAIGKIRFCVNEPATADIAIPQGTICCSVRNRLLRYMVTQATVLERSKTFVDASAKALFYGTEYNAKPGEITVMVVPPSGIDSVTNPEAFTGGYSGENDNMLRERAVNSFRNMPNGKNKQDMLDKILEESYVLDANIYKTEPPGNVQGKLMIVMRTVDDKIPSIAEILVQDLISYDMYPYDIGIELAKKVVLEYTLNLYVKTGVNKEETVEKAKIICKDYNESSRIGQVYSLIEMGEEIEKIPNVHHFTFETASGNKIFAPAGNEFIYSTSQEVVAYDW